MREKEVPLPLAIARTWAPASTLIATVGSMAADSTHSVGEDELPKLFSFSSKLSKAESSKF